MKATRKQRNMATAPTRNKPSRTARRSRETAEKIAEIFVAAVENKLADLPKEERMKERERIISSLRSGRARR